MADRTIEVQITADAQGLKQGVQEGQQAIKKFTKASKEQTEAFDKAFDKAKESCKKAIKEITTFTTVAIGAMVGLAESTKSLRENQAKINTAFGDVANGAGLAKQAYDELYRVLGDDDKATEAGAHLGKLVHNEQELAQWTTICEGIFATFGDSLPIEGLTEAANETAKTGKVVGVLADALNWAGVSEDEFNEKLSKCATAQEREALIRKTLNGLYTGAAAQYEKTARSTLKANEAQNKLNKSLAKAGAACVPLSNSLKELGADLLDKAQKPLEKVVSYITSKVIPAISRVAGAVIENGDAILSMMGGLAVGFVVYKAAVVATELATKGLTAAMAAQLVVQKGIDAITKASPWGVVLTVIAAAITALSLYVNTLDDTAKSVSGLTDEQIALINSCGEVNEAFRSQQDELAKVQKGVVSQAEHAKKLVAELGTLADANGYVQEADRARVEFILNELNEAYGFEYEMIDGQIQKYDELVSSIYDVINAKTAEALVENEREAYITALQDEQDAWGALTAAQQEYEAQLAIVNQKEQELAQVKAERNKASIEGNEAEVYSLQNRMNLMEKQLGREKDILNERGAAYDEARERYLNNQEEINTFEAASIALLEGNTQQVIDLMTKQGGAWDEYALDVDEANNKVLNKLFQDAVDAGVKAKQFRENWENGVAGYTEEMVLEAEQAAEETMNAFETAYADAHSVGQAMGDGLESGINSRASSLAAAAAALVKNAIAAARRAADSHSPSKKMIRLGKDMGAGARIGIDESTEDVVSSSEKMINKSLKPVQMAFSAYSAKDLSSIFKTAEINRGIGQPVSGDSSRSMMDNLTSVLLSGTERPIILQVDGMTFAKTSINTINQLTRQTGSLSLNLA